MREGPLAELFRKTEGEGAEQQQPKRREPEPEQPKRPEREPEQPQPQPQPRLGREYPADPEADPREEREALEQLRPAPPSARVHHREPEAPAEPERRVPTAEERLRAAFSSDIPENILERETPKPAPYSAPPDVAPRYGREEPTAPAAQPMLQPMLRVVGVGGAGVNAVNRMVEAEVEGVEFLAINTDLQSLQQSSADITLHIGAQLTRGLGSGSNPELGRQSALEDYDRIKGLLKGSDMIFITAGSGGGTGTGAAPVVARIARELGSLTVGIVTKPFAFEGSRRAEQADEGIEELSREVDTLIVIPNSRLLTVLDKRTSMVDAFGMADDVLRQGVQGISDLITLPGLINLDFADVRTIMAEAGTALLGIGMGVGENRAIEAAERAVASPLLETSVEGARSILLSITGGRDLSLWEVNEAAKAVAEAAHPDANIIFGAMVDEKVVDQVWVTVVATGYGDKPLVRAGARRERESNGFREPAGEPRVTRTRGSSLADLDVPEFVPRR